MLHISFWVGYFLFKVNHEFVWLRANYPEDHFGEVIKSALVAQSLMLISKVGFAYWMYLRWLPAKFAAWLKGLNLVLGFIVTIVVYRFIIVQLVLPLAYGENPELQPLFTLERISSATIDVLLAVGVFMALMIYRSYVDSMRAQQDLREEKLTTELKLLKSQTNPHFLFNTLNSIYVLARKSAANTSDAIMQLSNMMRFVLYETQSESILLSKEVDVIKDYIALEQLRFGDRLKLSVDLQSVPNLCISPMLMVSMVENAFKHSAEMEGAVEIRVYLKAERSNLRFKVENSARETRFEYGLGLSNLKRQLEIQYPDHKLVTMVNGGYFTADLELNLSK